jgi:hypothetical protein
MEKSGLIERLRKKRSILLKAYVFYVIRLASTFASAVKGATRLALPTLLIFTLITVPPVLIYTVSVHKVCRAIDSSAQSVGLVPVILFTIFLTPLESGLILPLKNLWVSRCILRRYETLIRDSKQATLARDA